MPFLTLQAQSRTALLVALLVSLVVLPQALTAQDTPTLAEDDNASEATDLPAAAVTETATMAPTKTPALTTPQTATLVATSQPTVSAGRQVIQAFTQADLSILTGNVQRPNGMVWFNGNLYISCSGDWTIYETDAVNGRTRAYISGVRNAHALYAESDENDAITLWVPDFQNRSLTQVTRLGIRQIATEMNGPWGIAALDETTFAVSNLLGNTVSAVGREGERREAIINLTAPTGLVFSGDTLYVANNGSTRRSIEWFDADSLNGDEPVDSTRSDAHMLVSGLQNTTGMVLGSDGYLYFAYSLGTRGVVGRIDPEPCKAQGGCTHDQVEIVVLSELAAPIAGLTLSPDMRLYMHTMFSPDLYWVQL